MVLNDDQVIIPLDEEQSEQVFITRHPLSPYLLVSVLVRNARVTVEMLPKDAHAVAAALIAFAGDAP